MNAVDGAAQLPVTGSRRIRPATVIVGLLLAFALAWVLFLAEGTAADPAFKEPGEFLVTLMDGIMTGLLGADSVMATPPEGAVMTAVFCAVAVAIVVGSYAILLARYRKALS